MAKLSLRALAEHHANRAAQGWKAGNARQGSQSQVAARQTFWEKV